MYVQHCDFCGQPIEAIDFHLTFKGGCVCPACVPLARAAHPTVLAGSDACRETDTTLREQIAMIPFELPTGLYSTS